MFLLSVKSKYYYDEKALCVATLRLTSTNHHHLPVRACYNNTTMFPIHPHTHAHSTLHTHRLCLTWRDIQAIVIYSALTVDVSGAHWVANGAGFHHSDQHGFGLMDSYRLTLTAAVWPLLPAMVVISGAVAIPTNGQPLIQTIKTIIKLLLLCN